MLAKLGSLLEFSEKSRTGTERKIPLSPIDTDMMPTSKEKIMKEPISTFAEQKSEFGAEKQLTTGIVRVF